MAEPKVVLVTGSSSGIGEAIVKLLAKKGYQVVVVGSKADKVERVANECVELSPLKLQPLSLVLDFNDPINGEVAVKETVKHFRRLDVLINNAGIFTRSPGDDPSTYDTYRQAMTINTDATVRASLAAAEHLKITNGNLIFISSVAAARASQHGYAYCVSKAAMSMFAKCLAIDLAPRVRVNIVSPGPVRTAIFERVGWSSDVVEENMPETTLQNKIGTTSEVASIVSFIISDEASFVTGHELFVDGGYLLKYNSTERFTTIDKELRDN